MSDIIELVEGSREESFSEKAKNQPSIKALITDNQNLKRIMVHFRDNGDYLNAIGAASLYFQETGRGLPAAIFALNTAFELGLYDKIADQLIVEFSGTVGERYNLNLTHAINLEKSGNSAKAEAFYLRCVFLADDPTHATRKLIAIWNAARNQRPTAQGTCAGQDGGHLQRRRPDLPARVHAGVLCEFRQPARV